jgi:hypothetical protein
MSKVETKGQPKTTRNIEPRRSLNGVEKNNKSEVNNQANRRCRSNSESSYFDEHILESSLIVSLLLLPTPKLALPFFLFLFIELRALLLVQMLGVSITLKRVSIVVAGAGVAGLLARSMVDAANYITLSLRLDFFLFIPSLSIVSYVQLTRCAGFGFRFKVRTRYCFYYFSYFGG